MLMGDSLYSDAANTYRNNNSDRSALDRLREVTGGARIGQHIADAVGNKQAMVIAANPANTGAFMPVWDGITIVPDDVTAAKKGQIIVTAFALFNIGITRTTAYRRRQVQTQ